MQTRRDFFRSAAALSGAAFAWGSIPEAIARAAAITPRQGSTYLDAEHVVILMQENRSFDHAYGALRGVRGFRDPRAHLQPNGDPVWFQRDAHGESYSPFRLDITDTNATWIGGLPHSWTDQVDARNGGRYDKWLIAKPKRDLTPFTLGHYRRDDIPFYYALADAFTVCDQAFCSSLTGTTANRLFLWTGTIRRDASDFPRVQNADTDYDREAAWPTYPERLQDAGVSWRIYQNELSVPSGLADEEDAWLANFGDNPIEWFTQFKVRFAATHRAYMEKLVAELPDQIAAKERAAAMSGASGAAADKARKEIDDLKARLTGARAERRDYHDAAWQALSARAKALHTNAFAINDGDEHFRSLTTLSYQDGATARDVRIPAGDLLHRFRQDVANNTLPAVSWVVAPQACSDHPSAAWYGAWYVSEVLDALTRNPEVWKKTIFVLCYDENDGYFDHVPPFVAPHPKRPETGKVSEGIDTTIDWANVYGRNHSIGLGYRVPLVVASPWSRGGCVNSQVFDHTSILQLVESWLAHNGKPVRETNISTWRRTVCGDLSSAFRPYNGEPIVAPTPLERDKTVARINAARYRPRPDKRSPLSAGTDAMSAAAAEVRALQETGTRPSCPLPYDLHVNGERSGSALTVVMEARSNAFGARSQGAPFNAYSYGPEMICRSYAVRAGTVLRDQWITGGAYHLRVDGPNGFMREFKDGVAHTPIAILVDHASGSKATGRVAVRLSNQAAAARDIELRDESYGSPPQRQTLGPRKQATIAIDTSASHGWYDFTVRSGDLVYRYAGRIETGDWSITDPAMGRANG